VSLYRGNGHGRDRSAQERAPIGELVHDFFIDIGFAAERSGALALALDLYEKALRAEPDSPLAWYNYGDALLALRRLEDAVPALLRAVELSPGTALFRYDLGLALFELGRFGEAAKEFALIVDTDPELKRASSSLVVSAMTNLALSQGELGRPQEGADLLHPTRPMAASLLYNLGFLNYKSKRFAEALPAAQAAELLNPKSEDIVHLLGSLLVDLKRYREASDVLLRATKLNPECSSAWYDLGVSYAHLKQHKKARSCFQKARKLAPDQPWPYYDLACLDALERKRDKAFKNLELAVLHGFDDVRQLRRDPDLKSLRIDARWKVHLKSISRT
jgi:tetratricopeptide (TPR) repeat protein